MPGSPTPQGQASARPWPGNHMYGQPQPAEFTKLFSLHTSAISQQNIPTSLMNTLLLQETSDQRPPAGWTRIAYGGVEYYHNESRHLTTDLLEPLKESAGSVPPFSNKPNVDIHLPSLRSKEALYVYHDDRVAFWREWPEPTLAPGPSDAEARPHSRSSLSRTTLHNGSGVLHAETEPASPPPDGATSIAIPDEGTALDDRIRYWDYVRGHPGHVDVGQFGQIVREHLLWSRNERALSLSADPAFSHEECETFLRYLDAALLPPVATHTASSALQASAKARHTRLIAALMKRILKGERERQAQTCEKATAETWLRWILYLVLIQVIFLGQPNTYSRRLARFKRGKPLSLVIHTKYWQAFLGAFIKEWNDTNLLATVMISATVGFLAVPGLDSIARILGIIAIIAAIGSGLVGMVYVWHHGPRANTNAFVGRAYIATGKVAFGVRSTLLFACVLAVPVVLLWWSFLSFIAAVLVYAFRGQFLDPVDNTAQDFSMATKYVALVAFVLVLDCGAVGYVFMWRVWQPINEPWAASASTRPDNAGPSEPNQ